MSVGSERARVAPAPAVRALLREAIDYAGLFPPSEVALRDAVANYAAYRAEPDGWMLGKFVVPVGRLEELARIVEGGTSNRVDGFADAAAPATVNGEPRTVNAAQADREPSTEHSAPADREPGTVNPVWPVSAVLGAEALKEVEAVVAFNARHRGTLQVTAVEAKVGAAAEAARLAAAVPPDVALWVEFTAMPAEIPAALAAPNRGAKIRTGGVTPGSFPAAADVAAFMLACRRAGVRFKATAGLHHPVTGVYPLTYEAGSEQARMFGFLNVLLAATAVGRDLPIPPERRGAEVQTPIVAQEVAEGAEVRTGAVAQGGTSNIEHRTSNAEGPDRRGAEVHTPIVAQEVAEGAEVRTGAVAQGGTSNIEHPTSNAGGTERPGAAALPGEETSQYSGAPSVEELVAMLECDDPRAFVLEGEGISWRPRRARAGDVGEGGRAGRAPRPWSVDGLRQGRALLASFGSCSFVEPVEGLRELRWL